MLFEVLFNEIRYSQTCLGLVVQNNAYTNVVFAPYRSQVIQQNDIIMADGEKQDSHATSL